MATPTSYSPSISVNISKSTCSPLLLLIFFIFSMLLSSSSSSSSSFNLDDLAALRAIRDSLTDLPTTSPSARFFSTWDFSIPNPNPCSTFSGVVCSPLGRVDILSLGPALCGSLSPSISNLTNLTQLILYPGLVTGPIPPLLGPQTLRVISLTHNRLTGPIPTSLSSLPNLHTLDLSFNTLTGTIPPPLFSHHPQLRILVLSSNSLTGNLPGEVSTQLLHLDLHDNQLTGPLPPHLPSSLRYLSVSNNLMWGPLILLGNDQQQQQRLLSDLEYLDLSMNHFSGPIPPSLFLLLNNYSLSSIFLQRNNLSGPLPQIRLGPRPTNHYYNNNNYVGWGGERSVAVVDLSHNMLGGELTTALAGVESLYLNNNLFAGRVPREYVEGLTRGTIKTLYLQHNYFTQFPLTGPFEKIPDTASLCMCYNCVPLQVPQWTAGCPTSAGSLISRPISQCNPTHAP